ncbi:MAG: hypothetical protein N0A24_07570 [Armatimonadetes bacterium]|nr:hypothetical protein [Armatimonadota bacterium]MDW8154059.1 hypothetical protein [Armatimonadota bacterium]
MRTASVLVATAVLLAVAAPAGAQARVEGNPQWWCEVAESFDRLARVRTYRMRMTPSAGTAGVGSSVWEFAHAGPARASRMVTRWSQGGREFQVETVQIGNDVWQRTSGPAGTQVRWVKLQAPPASLPGPWDPARPQDVGAGTVRMLSKAAGTHRTPRGQVRAVYVYEFQVQRPGAVTVHNSLAVDRQTGLPLRLTIRSAEGGGPAGPAGPGIAPPQAFTMEYYDHGAAIRITVPAGCPR